MSERADRREERVRDAIAKTAAEVRRATGMTHTEAKARVVKARERGDNIRSSTPTN